MMFYLSFDTRFIMQPLILYYAYGEGWHIVCGILQTFLIRFLERNRINSDWIAVKWFQGPFHNSDQFLEQRIDSEKSTKYLLSKY